MDKVKHLESIFESIYTTLNYLFKGVPNSISGNKGELSKLDIQK